MTVADTLDLVTTFGAHSGFDSRYYDYFNVKRGLRNADGTGVVAGLTSISNVHGYLTDEGVRIPDEGRLTLRGYDIGDLVENAVAEGRFGFEEIAALLWSGELPTREQLAVFQHMLDEQRDLPQNFVNNLIMNWPSKNVMNMMARSVLMLYADDDDSELETPDPAHEVAVATELLSRLPRIAVLSYLVGRYKLGEPVYINPPQDGLSTAETLLYMLRPDRSWDPKEARILDIMLMLHAEHGGGNNSTFSTRCLTSSGTDPYSAYAGGICSLKGPKHGGANIRAAHMQQDILDHVADSSDEGQIADYLRKILAKEAYDGSGLIYGMGHALYTLSDPRAIVCKRYAREMARGTEFEARFELIDCIERLTPELFEEVKGKRKAICANIDMYSGLVYRMIGIPEELYTPVFAVARMAGWAAHRFEEIVEGKRIMRPAYKSANGRRAYIALDSRGDAEPDEAAPIVHEDHYYTND